MTKLRLPYHFKREIAKFIDVAPWFTVRILKQYLNAIKVVVGETRLREHLHYLAKNGILQFNVGERGLIFYRKDPKKLSDIKFDYEILPEDFKGISTTYHLYDDDVFFPVICKDEVEEFILLKRNEILLIAPLSMKPPEHSYQDKKFWENYIPSIYQNTGGHNYQFHIWNKVLKNLVPFEKTREIEKTKEISMENTSENTQNEKIQKKSKIRQTLTLQESFILQALINEEYTTSGLNDKDFAQMATSKLGFEVLDNHVLSRRSAFKIKNNTPRNVETENSILSKLSLDIASLQQRVHNLEMLLNAKQRTA